MCHLSRHCFAFRDFIDVATLPQFEGPGQKQRGVEGRGGGEGNRNGTHEIKTSKQAMQPPPPFHLEKASYRIPQHTHTTFCLRIWSTHVLLCLDCTNQPIVDDLVRKAVAVRRTETEKNQMQNIMQSLPNHDKTARQTEHDTTTTTPTTTSLTLRGAA